MLGSMPQTAASVQLTASLKWRSYSNLEKNLSLRAKLVTDGMHSSGRDKKLQACRKGQKNLWSK